MESIQQEGTLTVIGWIAAIAILAGILGLFYVISEKQNRVKNADNEQTPGVGTR